jgi:mannose/cellobiose epimerase-like protein (N-acyl-D-glucosamine 2-epimerase family)
VTRPGAQEWRRDQAARLLAFGRGSARPGGGFGWLADDGTLDTGKPRPLYITARMTYSYALAHLDTGDPGALELATSGVRSLSTEYADREYGGWYASLDNVGGVVDASKPNYAHAFVLLASATALTAGVEGAADVLELASATIDRHFWSEDEGCARESWDRAFSVSEPYRGANSNMHSLEAYLAAGDVTRDSTWHTRGLSIADRLINTHAREHGWRIPEHYDESWQPVLNYNEDARDDPFRPFGTTPGHSFEWARLLLALEASLDDAPAWLAEAAVGLFEAALAHGWAADSHPGFVYTLDFDDRPVVVQRLHWVVCEAVLAAHSLHRRTDEARYGQLADEWWEHIDRHFLDTVRGGWWQELDPTLAPSTTIWSGKPDVYHSYQALLFPSLPLAPSAATYLARRGDDVA